MVLSKYQKEFQLIEPNCVSLKKYNMSLPVTDQNRLTAQDYKNYFEKAIGYSDYLQNFKEELAIGEESPFAQYLPQNWQRQSRLDRKLQLRDDLVTAVDNINAPLKWLVITEHWCGDASQINPIINKMAEESRGKIELRFIYRDENEALIDAHLTDGKSRSIPKLLQLDHDYNLKNTYGPRPTEAQKLVKSLLAKGEVYNIPLHTWYAKDKQKSIQDDLLGLLTD
jgi:hypothetical protein